jgi:choline dehydrogenase-like flavoprotein
MARTDPRKDVVIVGLGWTGAIVAMELAQEGLEVLALERGPDRATVPDFQYPKVIDELKYGIRYGFIQKPRNSTLTIRRTLTEVAQPYRRAVRLPAGPRRRYAVQKAQSEGGTQTTLEQSLRRAAIWHPRRGQPWEIRSPFGWITAAHPFVSAAAKAPEFNPVENI